MHVSKALIRNVAEAGFFKGKLKEAFLNRSPIGVSVYTMPVEDAMDLFSSMDLTKRPKLLNFLAKFTEDQIATNGFASQRYAELVLQDRFKLGEPAIRGNWGGIGGLAGDMWKRYVQTTLARPPYAEQGKLTEEGKALYYEFERIDNQIIRERV